MQMPLHHNTIQTFKSTTATTTTTAMPTKHLIWFHCSIVDTTKAFLSIAVLFIWLVSITITTRVFFNNYIIIWKVYIFIGWQWGAFYLFIAYFFATQIIGGAKELVVLL